MAHTNETFNYKLPQFVDTDQPTWLGDFNGAMETLDTAITKVGANASTALSAANNAVNRVGQAETTIAGVQTTANNAYSLASTNEKDISTLDGQVAQLETKFPVTSANLANGAVTAEKLDQTAVAAMWKSQKVRRFDNQDPTADNTGLVVPATGNCRGYYLADLGLLIIHSIYIHNGTPTDEGITLPSYVPLAPRDLKISFAGILWTTTNYFASWTEAQIDAGTRKLTFKSRKDTSQALNGSSIVLYIGGGTTSATSAASYTASNGTL